jgi:hypothetical protein
MQIQKSHLNLTKKKNAILPSSIEHVFNIPKYMVSSRCNYTLYINLNSFCSSKARGTTMVEPIVVLAMEQASWAKETKESCQESHNNIYTIEFH